MKKHLVAGVAAAAFAATGADALVLTGAKIEGVTNISGTTPTGTVWDTIPNDFFLAVLQQPLGTILNGNDPASISIPTVDGINNFAVSGEGWPTPGVNNSDLFYRLTLGFDSGASVSGVYDTVANNFVGSTSGDITLTGFLWERQLFDVVSPNSSVAGGSPADYNGGFSFSVTAVPEPATWAMLIGGFGLVGFGMRRQNIRMAVAHA